VVSGLLARLDELPDAQAKGASMVELDGILWAVIDFVQVGVVALPHVPIPSTRPLEQPNPTKNTMVRHRHSTHRK